MGAYGNDKRVEKLDNDEYRISHWNGVWIVREVEGWWNAYDQDGVPSRIVCGMSSDDRAIAAIIGDPR